MLSIKNTTKKPTPKLPFAKILSSTLGDGFELSLVFCGDKKISSLSERFFANKKHKNVLAFALDENMGEVFINLNQAKKEASLFNHSYREHVLYLFIHACLHLSGEKHGKHMEQKEESLLKKFYKQIS